ncbi:MAG: secretin N-terminal domain-containing protein [Nitrospinae bacterium]|nr:secretin N-terminal domain-containing protein [Nitrospinota bacterium]MBL7021224.1 secretin N-terminal domain-containing protein [Nitrospinaceae bacterium]
MMTFNSTITSAFRSWGVLILSLGLASCSALDLAHIKSPEARDQAQKPPTHEVIIPLEKAQPSKLPESLTEIQPALDLKKPEPKGVRFTMSARGVDIKNVLFALSQEIDQNIVIDPNINKLASVDLKNVTLTEALESLLPPLHLQYKIDEKLIRVQRKQMQTRTFFLNYVISKRVGKSILKSSSGTSGTSATAAGSGSGSGAGAGTSSANARSTSSIEASEETDIWTNILSGLKSIATPSASTQNNSSGSTSSSGASASGDSSGGDSAGLVSSLLGGADPSSTVESSGTVEQNPASSSAAVQGVQERAFLTVNQQAGMIVVKDFPDVLLQIAEFLENIEGSIQRQVFIQAKIIEITLNDEYKLGVDWAEVSPLTISHSANTLLGDTAITGATNFAYGLANSSFNIVVDALSKQGQVSVLSSPKIATLNNQRAVIKVGTDDIFFSPETTAATTTSGATVQYVPETITIGIILDVVPQINPNGQIMMSINTSITEKAGERTSPDGINIVPILDVRESNNVVLAQHGQTIVIGGLMKTKKQVDDNSVPLLGAIPYVGRLFHWENETVSKTELVIMLTPEIMAGQAVDDKFNSASSDLRNLGYDARTNHISNPTFRR